MSKVEGLTRSGMVTTRAPNWYAQRTKLVRSENLPKKKSKEKWKFHSYLCLFITIVFIVILVTEFVNGCLRKYNSVMLASEDPTSIKQRKFC